MAWLETWFNTGFLIDSITWSWTLGIYLAGIAAAIDAIWNGRTSQGTLAWVIALTFIPFFTLPLYLFFGSRKFHGYNKARKSSLKVLKQLHAKQELCAKAHPSNQKSNTIIPLEALSRLPQSEQNHVQLLINGEQTFTYIFQAIKKAKHSILVQFYIVNDGELGQRLQQALIAKAKEGVSVYFLYDEIGSSSLRNRFLTPMENAGIECSRFNPRKVIRRLQLNFRNHRKLVVIDNQTCFIGGHNVGDEYLGHDPKIGFWRDTHLQIDGPATLAAQLSFAEDWYWAQQKILDLKWQAHSCEHNAKALIIPSGPADTIETMSLSFVQLILSAKNRIWIATPYFIPDLSVMSALQLAALKGLDVRILLPKKNDNAIIALAMRNYVSELRVLGITFLQYQQGFMHQKVMLIDDDLSYIGSANLDNRSLRINFELNALIECEKMATEVETMFLHDFSCSEIYPQNNNLLVSLAAKAARLLSPIL
ncbi:Cardiolipin synthetase [Oleispira antarctica RB-8]|uniref:Cardiolipin synthase n=1 Tax=Oleispira antarctica RB-8 TaxID=698738 RepID=R4YSU6_OLEAN|nr:Cardiolipin synthetase [Oleispira antarctica RB-8]